jgi:nucleotide-binding universal stress UspA family protein
MQDYFESLVVPVDFGPKTSLVIKQAYILGQLMNCDIVLMYVHDVGSNEPEKPSMIEAKLFELASTAQEKYNLNFYPVMSYGDVSDAIIGFAKENYAKMIVMGSLGSSSGNNNHLIGKNTSKIIREAMCPVLTINSEIIYDLDKILLPLDLSKPFDQKLNWAIYFSRFFGCIIKVISIAPHGTNPTTGKNVEKMFQVKSYLNDCNVFCTTDILTSKEPIEANSKQIVEYARQNDCDLIMVMTQQEDLKRETLVGRTASGIISRSDKPVISITPLVKSEMSKNC